MTSYKSDPSGPTNLSSYAKIRLMRSEMKGFERIAPEILSEICEDPTDVRFTVDRCNHLSVNRQFYLDV